MKLVVDKASLVSVADAIRTKGNTTESLEFPNGFVDGINAIESGGGGGTEEIENIIDQSGVLENTDGTVTDKVKQLIDKAENENMWLTNVANVTTAVRLFNNYPLAQLPKLPVLKSTTLAYWFANSKIERIDFYIDVKSDTTFVANSAFEDCQNLTFMVGINTLNCTDARSLLNRCYLLKTIQMPLDFSNIKQVSNAFNGCFALEDVSFVLETIKVSITIPSPVLSNESIKSILRGLAYVETTQTLKVSPIVYSKMYENELYDYLDEALTKGWDITT